MPPPRGPGATHQAATPARSSRSLKGFAATRAEAELALEAQFMASVSPASISAAHRWLTDRPHLAGTQASLDTADEIRAALERAGLAVTAVDYQPYLSLPRRVRIELTAPAPETLTVREPVLADDPDTAHADLTEGFVSYSASAEVTGPAVYVNYGLPADYARLASAGVDVRGRIAVARYARSHRAVKVHTAEQQGAAGIIIYSDPADDGYARGDMWPAGPWRSAGLLQRGNAKYSWFWHGDPLTPGRPALEGATRLDPATVPTLPRIPAAVLSWREAEKILRGLAGPAAPSGFQGGLPFTYHIGPGPVSVRLAVEMDASHRPIRNVIARIEGRTRPDRWVLAGTHHDAWTFGGVDPGSSAAVMIEVATRLAALRQRGWQPDRSIVFAFWDAEEPGLVGSTEFAEDRARELAERVVCYINSDLYLQGRFDAGGVPSLRDFVVEVARHVPDGTGTVYDGWRAADWRRQSPQRRRAGEAGFEVELGALGSGADFVAFQDHLGLPTLSMEFDFEGSYGTYHSSHDTRRYMETAGDPGFNRGAVLAQVLGLTIMRLAAADVLPLAYGHYAGRIAAFIETASTWALDDDGRVVVEVDLDPVRAEAARAVRAARELDVEIDRLTASGGLPERPVLDRFNDALVAVERTLLDERGPPAGPWYRHVIYGWNIYSLYDGQPLPGLADAMRVRDRDRASREAERVARALGRMTDAMSRATTMLRR
jgi:N-acetylated-alpha-linked acidic dipeptidase